MQKPELLSPCGSPKALEAALKAGADAVYMGGTMLNARMNAANFDDAAMRDAVKLCHDSGVRIYVTLNTLVYDREIHGALKYAGFLYESGVDALIVADLGLAGLLHRYIPEFPLHSSTQACGFNTASAERLAELGFSRMVCARELDFESIKKLAGTSPIDIEMFIHGAHCVSRSGQCLFSSLVGGRSGNRGECAQPCRMSYNGSYPLSLKDMCLAGHMTEIMSAKVCSLKIEGRMKSPDYVYAVTRIYRKLIDEGRNASKSEMGILEDVFSRGGFTDAYFTGRIGKGMLGVRSESDKNATRKLSFAEDKLKRTLPKIEISERSANIAFKPETVKKSIQLKRKTARFEDPSQIPDSHDFDVVYLPLDKFERPAANGVILPPFVNENVKIPDCEHVMITDITQKPDGHTLHGDFRLNVLNSYTAELFGKEANFEDVILSPELTLPQIRDISSSKSVIVYGRIPLMMLEKRVGAQTLRDRINAVFPVIDEFGRDIVLNSVPVYMADRMDELYKIGVSNTHYIFTVETKKECASIIRAYEKRLPPVGNCRRIKASNKS